MCGEFAGCPPSLWRDIIKPPTSSQIPALFNAYVRDTNQSLHQNLHFVALGGLTAARGPNHITALKTVTG